LEKRGVDQVRVPQRQVRHILIKPTEILSSDDARLKLEDIRSKIIAGSNFADEARIHSDDPGSARQGGELGWVGAGEMVPEFEKMMSSAQAEYGVGDFSVQLWLAHSGSHRRTGA
jgi:peptidyl-prolyl cis-trans isomerase SurA